MPGVISPDDLHAKVCKQALAGKRPTTTVEWQLVAHGWAENVAEGYEQPILKIMAMLYECPLSAEYLDEVAQVQLAVKLAS